MRVLIAAAQFSSHISGLQRHALNMVRCLLTQPDITHIDIVFAPWQMELAEIAGLNAMARLTVHIAEMDRGAWSRNRWFYTHLPALVTQLQPDIVHLSYPVPIDAKAIGKPIALTLHDLYPFEIPENFGHVKVFFNRAILRNCLQGADAIACVSDATLHQLSRYMAPSISKKATRIYNSVERETAYTLSSPIPLWNDAPFLLTVSQHRRNKNIPLTIHAFHKLLCEKRINPAMKLVIVGIPGPDTSFIHSLIAELGLDGHVTTLWGLSEAELQWCYRQCEAVLAPSETEGFGLPVAEAVLTGCRLVCSDIPAFREIDAPHCDFFQLGDGAPEKLAAAIVNCLKKPIPPPIDLPQLSFEIIGAEYTKLYRQMLQESISSPVLSLSRPGTISATEPRSL